MVVEGPKEFSQGSPDFQIFTFLTTQGGGGVSIQ